MSKLSYWLDNIGKSGLLLGPTEAAGRVIINGKYLGPYQLDEGMTILTGGAAAWNAAKYIEENEKKIKRSPLVHIGRGLEVAGSAWTELNMLTGNTDNIYRAFGPVLGVPIGGFLEFIAGPIHERFSKRYKSQAKKER